MMNGNFWALDDLVELLFASARAKNYKNFWDLALPATGLRICWNLPELCQAAQVNLLVVCHVKGVEVYKAEGFQTVQRDIIFNTFNSSMHTFPKEYVNPREEQIISNHDIPFHCDLIGICDHLCPCNCQILRRR